MSVIIGICRHFAQENPGGSPAHVCDLGWGRNLELRVGRSVVLVT